MAVDRDLEVALGRVLAPTARSGARAWEMTAATGVRGLRLLLEAGGFAELVSSETGPAAVRVLAANAGRYADRGARAVVHDARTPLEHAAFDLVDLDPYGSPAPFLDAAVDAVLDGGLLALTATDLRVLAGVERGACERRYGGRPVRGRLGPEAGLRILLAWVDRRLRSEGRHARPILAYVRDHHVRAYLEVERGPAPSPVAEVDPATWLGPPLPLPGPYGPMWLGPLFDRPTVGALAVPPTAARPRELARLLTRLQEEVEVDVPFYFEPNEIARTLRLPRPPAVASLLEALRSEGYGAARTHVRDGAVRTTAPRARVEAIVRDRVGLQSQNERVRA